MCTKEALGVLSKHDEQLFILLQYIEVHHEASVMFKVTLQIYNNNASHAKLNMKYKI